MKYVLYLVAAVAAFFTVKKLMSGVLGNKAQKAVAENTAVADLVLSVNPGDTTGSPVVARKPLTKVEARKIKQSAASIGSAASIAGNAISSLIKATKKSPVKSGALVKISGGAGHYGDTIADVGMRVKKPMIDLNW